MLTQLIGTADFLFIMFKNEGEAYERINIVLLLLLHHGLAHWLDFKITRILDHTPYVQSAFVVHLSTSEMRILFFQIFKSKERGIRKCK